jgi:hypothetical protein
MRVARLLLLACLLALLFFGNVPEHTRFWEALFDAGHAPLFGVIALLVHGLLSREHRAGRVLASSALAFGVTLILAAGTEAVQYLQPERDVSTADFLRDSAGAGAFLLLGAAWRAPQTARARVAAALAAVLLAAAAAELIYTTSLYAARDRAFPTLYALDGSWRERPFIDAGANTLTPGQVPAATGATEVGPLARLDLNPGLYPGLAFDEPYPDWRGFRRLTFTVVSDLDQPLELTIRVHDALHDLRYADRFNRRVTIKPGVNRIAIPVDDIRRAPGGREMDLRRIRGIMIFAYRLEQPLHLYLGPLRLE